MSTASETDVDTAAADEAAAAAANNPVILGISAFAVGGFTLGFFLLGYPDAGLTAPVAANSAAVAGLGLLISTFWAIRLGAGAVAAIFGVFAGFWFSFTLMLLGFGATPGPDPVRSALGALVLYTLVWTIVVVVLTLVTLRLPLAYTVLIALVAVALLLVFLSYAAGAAGLATIAGWIVIVFSVLGLYIMADAFGQALGGKGLPLGNPLVKS
jgi:succinate-acetate transporter protein